MLGKKIIFFKHIILFTFYSSILYSQSNEMNSISIKSKSNGIVVQMNMDNLPDLSNVTAWQASSGWFYITMYKVKGDSTSLMPRRLPSEVIDFQIVESDESIQVGIRIKQPIENHDFLLVKKSNTMVASLHYSTEYLAQLETVKKMNLGQQNKEIHQEIRNWLYITGAGLTVAGLILDSDNKVNLQTQSGLGILITTLLLDLIW